MMMRKRKIDATVFFFTVFTTIRSVLVSGTVVGRPSYDFDEIGDETRHQTFQYAGVPFQDEFVDYSRLIELLDHYNN